MKRFQAPRSSAFNGRTKFYHAALGKTFVDYEFETIFRCGDATLTRMEIATKLGCPHLGAIRRLSKNLELHGIDSINKLHATPPDELAGLADIGTIQMFCAMLVMDHFKFDAVKWYGHDADTVTASTLRRRAKKAEEEERKAARR